jgi:hypothetical protein
MPPVPTDRRQLLKTVGVLAASTGIGVRGASAGDIRCPQLFLPPIWRIVMLRAALSGAILVACAFSSAIADDLMGRSRTQQLSFPVVSPIFNQVVMFSLPKEFKTVTENTSPYGNQYIREAVLQGETANQWSQMVTVTGAKGLAPNPNVSPQLFAEQIANSFKRACPSTFFAKGLGAIKISEQDAFVMLASCGTVPSNGNKHSETALIISIRGSADYYTIQWAERESASDQPLAPKEAKWMDRFKKLNPIKICPLVPGEPAPYPSCISQK